jgi:hypothetical protein
MAAGFTIAILVAFPFQISVPAALQAEQSARDIYGEFVALSISKPDFAVPDYCSLKTDPDTSTANSHYIKFLPYTAEQVTFVCEG